MLGLRGAAVAPVACVVTALLVGGCGSDVPAASGSDNASRMSSPSSTPTEPSLAALPAGTIVQRAQAALKAAETMRVKGAMVSEDQSISLDLRYGKTGTAGTKTIGGAGLALIVIGATTYIKPSEALWRQQLPSGKAAAMIKVMKENWLMAPTSDSQWGSFAQFADKDTFVTELFRDVKATKLKKKGPKTIDGVRCIGVDDGEGILWVDLANARPVRLDPPSGQKGALTISEYNAVAEPKAPPAELIIDSTNQPG